MTREPLRANFTAFSITGRRSITLPDRLAALREGQELGGEVHRLVQRLLGLLQHGERLLPLVDRQLRHRDVAEDALQQVVEVVGDAAGERPDGLELLRLEPLLLEQLFLRDVREEPHEAGPAVELHGDAVDAHPDRGAVLAPEGPLRGVQPPVRRGPGTRRRNPPVPPGRRGPERRARGIPARCTPAAGRSPGWRTGILRFSMSATRMPTEAFSMMVRNRASEERSASSVRLDSVTSRVTPSSAVISPVSLRSGTACVSSHRRRPFRPVISNSKVSDSPRKTRLVRSRNGCRNSGVTSGQTHWPRTWSRESASSMSRPARFIRIRFAFSSSSLTHSGSASKIAWSSRSLLPQRLHRLHPLRDVLGGAVAAGRRALPVALETDLLVDVPHRPAGQHDPVIGAMRLVRGDMGLEPLPVVGVDPREQEFEGERLARRVDAEDTIEFVGPPDVAVGQRAPPAADAGELLNLPQGLLALVQARAARVGDRFRLRPGGGLGFRHASSVSGRRSNLEMCSRAADATLVAPRLPPAQ